MALTNACMIDFLALHFVIFHPLFTLWLREMLLNIFVLITPTNNEQTKTCFPGKKSPRSSARIEVAGADQFITGPRVRLIEHHGSGLTLQQFYYWNCRAECSTEG